MERSFEALMESLPQTRQCVVMPGVVFIDSRHWGWSPVRRRGICKGVMSRWAAKGWGSLWELRGPSEVGIELALSKEAACGLHGQSTACEAVTI